MENSPIILERLFNASPAKLWNALTDKNEMKKWYFDLPEFKAEIGFKFQFSGGPSPEKEYIHLCEITELIPEKKLSYSWSYLGYSGISYVSFELFEQENKTLLRLTHRGIESFPKENLDFAIGNFKEGWNHIINTSLSAYLKSIEQKV
ncbi:MAG: SRPBCC domain-containing protein [Saprospiraceae bacterium]|nr:SRPBCC domain-containing protein [Saprospiraceae bacterium]